MVSSVLRTDELARRSRLRTAFVVLETGGGLSPSPVLLDEHMCSLSQIHEASDLFADFDNLRYGDFCEW
jgi:hypothetical protein